MSARLNALRQNKADNVKKIKDISASAGTGAMSDEQRKDVAALRAANQSLDLDIQSEETLQAEEAALAAASPAHPDSTAAGKSTQITGGDPNIMKSPSFFGAALHSIRKIAIKEASTQDFQMAKMLAGPTGASSDVPSDGGFLIAPDRANSILQRSYDTGALLSLVTRQPVTGNALSLPAVDETSRANGSRFGGISSTWIGQGTTVTAGKPKFRLMELKLKKLLAFVYGTDELVVDAAAFTAFVNRNLPLELNFSTEDKIVNGDGSNGPQGILNSGAAVTVTRNTANRVFYEDVSGMWKRMWAPLRKTAVWIIDQSVEQELEQISIAIGTAGQLAPIYKPAGISVGPDGTQGYSPATLYGRPILTTEYNAALGTVGDIILANLGEYTLIDKGNVDSAVSLDVAFLTDESVWRFRYRADGQLNWNAALTPKSGGATLSPVVTLT